MAHLVKKSGAATSPAPYSANRWSCSPVPPLTPKPPMILPPLTSGTPPGYHHDFVVSHPVHAERVLARSDSLSQIHGCRFQCDGSIGLFHGQLKTDQKRVVHSMDGNHMPAGPQTDITMLSCRRLLSCSKASSSLLAELSEMPFNCSIHFVISSLKISLLKQDIPFPPFYLTPMRRHAVFPQ